MFSTPVPGTGPRELSAPICSGWPGPEQRLGASLGEGHSEPAVVNTLGLPASAILSSGYRGHKMCQAIPGWQHFISP